MAEEKKEKSGGEIGKPRVAAAPAASKKKPAAAKQPVPAPAAKNPAPAKALPASKQADKKTTENKKPTAKKPAPEKPAKPAVTKTPAEKITPSKTSAAKSSKKQILFVSSEVSPFAGTGGLGEVIGSLPKSVNASPSGFEASVIVPLYESVSAQVREKSEFMFHINVPLGWRNQYCGLFRFTDGGVNYYFVDNEYYFKRPNLYGYYDDGERFAFFSRAVCELIPLLGFRPDILHCHDWQTALVPIYYKLYYQYREGYGGIKTIFTIHNIEYQGKYGKNIIEDVFGIDSKEYSSVEFGGCINLVKGAIDYADAVSTVSPTYAKELEDDFYAHGLSGVIRKNCGKIRGILNGVDTEAYNPETNPALFSHYSATDPQNKAKNKAELQKMLSLPVNPSLPVVAIISRLVSHKGLDLIRFAMDDILKMNLQLVVLGKGDPAFEEYFTHLQKTFNTKVSSVIAFNKDLSHKIYSGADIFLMPSKAEPCGLSQMMACRYGTVPVVRATGGLADSIQDCGSGDGVGNGFVFRDYNAADMMHALSRATGLYSDYRDKWNALVLRCMKSDFSWVSSAGEYIKFYKELI